MIQMSVLRRPLAATLASVAVLLAGCGSTPKEPESKWSAERLYAEAKEEASQGNYERAGKLYERLEGRASGTALAQQAQIERAYMLYKSSDKAQALSVLERFIKLHPTSAALDYATSRPRATRTSRSSSSSTSSRSRCMPTMRGCA